jgi:SAM-dependent methyltransferase
MSNVWSDLRRLAPISRVFGTDLGTPIDRYYIENFLRLHSGDIRGRVMEVGDATYTRKFGGDRVEVSDVLHATPGNRKATIVGDLASGAGVPTGIFDCIILTQVLSFIYDMRSAVATAACALAPGGSLLVTVPGISQISRYDMDRWGDFWRFTDRSARLLFEESFEPAEVQVTTHGNVLVATAFLQGMPLEELTSDELDHVDPDYQVLITIRARRKQAA